MSPVAPAATRRDVGDAVRRALAESAPALPLPGAGDTATRWATLTRLSRDDVVVGRLVEAHVDADAILAEVLGERTGPGEWWAVWAAEPPHPRLTARRTADGWVLDGAKAWCSGAGLATHALVTADTPDGGGVGGRGAGDTRGTRETLDSDDGIHLLAVALDHPGVSTDLTTWRNPGMVASATGTVSFDGVPAREVGDRSAYLDRPGFWHGAIGVAACWLGGAERVADTLRRTASSRPLDPHALAHLGAVEATLAAARWSLAGAAAETDAAPSDHKAAHRRALVVRAVVEQAVTLTVDRVGRALGAAPLCLDADHAQAVADVQVYVRQSHAERDLAALGGLVAAGAGTGR